MQKSRRYIKKNRNRKTKRRYLGGGPAEMTEFIRSVNLHDDMKKLGAKKPVATPHSGTKVKDRENEIQLFIRLWNELDEQDKVLLKAKFKKGKGFTPNVHITPDEDAANMFIIYAEEYLNILAEAAGRTTQDILTMIASRGGKSEEDMNIINVAFNDEELSEEGQILKSKYMSLIPA